MSPELISHSPDLKQLQDDGYDVGIRANHLVISQVPYVNAKREVKYGTLVSELTLADDRTTAKPGTHVVYFIGDYPCNRDGSEISAIRHRNGPIPIDKDFVANYGFSNKPAEGYRDYHHKMTRYIEIISHPAQAIDPTVSAITFSAASPSPADESVFLYRDTASSRAGIYAITRKLELNRVGIVGLGGTGSYVLDLVAKTPVKEIHLFDGDQFHLHNAFRAPGAAPLDVMRSKPTKVSYFTDQYSKFRRKIIPHDYFIDGNNVNELSTMEFVFLCIDAGDVKKLIVEKLEQSGLPFIDVGMGIYEADGGLAGAVRTTTSTPNQREHLRKRVSMGDGNIQDEYSRNIQIADLNALNAALAVIKWKKLFGFYIDLDHEHHSTYTLNGNALLNEDLG